MELMESMESMESLLTPVAAPDYLLPCFSIRSRNELPAIDSINEKLYKRSRTDGAAIVTPITTGMQPYMDMRQNTSRTDTRDFKGNAQYMPGKDDTLSGPYFSKYDGVSDARNVAREITAVVYEPVETRGAMQSIKMTERQFSNRWTARSKAQAPKPR